MTGRAGPPKVLCIVSGGGDLEEAVEWSDAVNRTDLVVAAYRPRGCGPRSPDERIFVSPWPR